MRCDSWRRENSRWTPNTKSINMKNTWALLLSTALTLWLPSVDADARGKWWWFGGFKSAPKSTLPRGTQPPSRANNPDVEAPMQKSPTLVWAPGVIARVWNGVNKTFDVIAPKDRFYTALYTMRGIASWVQYLAFTPETLDSIAAAQYVTMMGEQKILPENHPTAIRVREITNKLTLAVALNTRLDSKMVQSMRWDIKTIDSPTVNAFCMPWGKMAIYTGIIYELELTDDEIAVIMWHEIAHALKQHSYKRLQSRLGSNTLISLAGAVSGRNLTAFEVGNLLWQLAHSREHEREADTAGLDIVRIAGYDVCAGEKVWEKMKWYSKSSPPAFLSTHPSHTERAQTLRNRASEMGKSCI